MAENQNALPVRRYMVPDYWPGFHCLAGDCRRSCCGGYWGIRFSRKDYLKLKHAEKPAELEERMKGSMYRIPDSTLESEYAGFRLRKDGTCFFQREDGLCALQCACGEEVLPVVCREFPRLTYTWLTGYTHKSCSMGCEAVLRLLWDRRDGLGFVDGPLEREEWKRVRVDVPSELAEEYPAVWELCIDLLQDRRHPLRRRILALGLLTQRMAEHSREESPAWCGWASAQREALESVRPALAELPGNREWFVRSNYKWLIELTEARSIGPDTAAVILKNLGTTQSANYGALEKQFQETFGDLDWFFENILVNQYFENGLPMGNLTPEDMWEHYVRICCLCFSFVRFCAVAFGPKTREELFDILICAGRSVYHGTKKVSGMVERMKEQQSDSLAAVAVLLSD